MGNWKSPCWRADDQIGWLCLGVATTKPQTRKVTIEDLLGIAETGGKLLNGRKLTCPGCEEVADILDYVPLEHSERHAAEVVVPLKCRTCRHVFALKP